MMMRMRTLAFFEKDLDFVYESFYENYFDGEGSDYKKMDDDDAHWKNSFYGYPLYYCCFSFCYSGVDGRWLEMTWISKYG